VSEQREGQVIATFGPFSLRDDGLLFAGDRHVALTPTEEAVLHRLVGAAGRLVTKEALIGSVWKGTAVTDGSLTRAIHTLRKRLADVPGGEAAIVTLYARGYRLALSVQAGGEPRLGTAPEGVPVHRKEGAAAVTALAAGLPP
jgi:DNA-binding winged helix-turn-helix (wHTH) protein